MVFCRVVRDPDPDGSAGTVGAAPVIGVKPDAEVAPKIRAFDQKLSGGLGSGAIKTEWKRKPLATGTGATHVKSFHCKLTGESLEFMDKQVNEWLEAHPEVEVKFVTGTVGEWLGKVKEPNLILQVWV
ncbi:MAG: hypothetical protein WD749_07745 [Phycisphaerales bacterium]